MGLPFSYVLTSNGRLNIRIVTYWPRTTSPH